MTTPFDQTAGAVRFEWGLAGARALARPGDLCVVVDVLSFTTSVDVACGRGALVLPYRWADETAAAYAVAQGAVLAAGRRVAGPGAVSLSPVTLRDAAVLERVVLPSPNGSTIATEVAGSGATVVAGCLRNANAVGAWVAARLSVGSPAGPRGVSVIAAGEQWPDRSLRPCAEDLWGAGAVITALVRARPEAVLSPEAELARAAYAAVASDLPGALREVGSGLELVASGFGDDVTLAADVDVSRCVPVLDETRAFRGIRSMP